ncbi:Uncharacterised protein [Candidatus Anstonella stagnisolia]|nr:Uncharacterised protein [Candidatus Anstonella stagnisolia]
MRLVLVFAVAILSLLLLFGCAGNSGAGNNTAGTPNTGNNNAGANSAGTSPLGNTGTNTAPAGITVSDDYGNEVSSLPAAYAGEQYYSEVYPSAGTYPFECTLSSGSGLPGEIKFAAGTCELSGRAPLLTSSKSTKAEYPFTFGVKDADGVTYGPFTLTLTVIPMPPEFIMINSPKPVQIGTPYSHDFCHPASDSPLNCGHTPPSDDPSSGIPPYTFTASSLPLGLTMRSDGQLGGTVPKGVLPGKQQIEVCAADSTGTVACANTTLTLLAPAEKWKGTLTGKNANTADSNLVSAGSSWKYDGTLEFSFPTSLVSLMRTSDISIETGNGTLGGTQSILSQSKFGTGVMKLTGGTVAALPVEVEAFGGKNSHSIEISAPEGSNFLSGYVETFHNDGSLLSRNGFFSDKIHLDITEVTDTSISGTWSFSEQYNTRPKGYYGTTIQTTSFTLAKVE